MAETVYLKAACEHCNGRIEYPSELAGQSIQCPHCQRTITLRSPSVSPPPIPPQPTPRPSLVPRALRPRPPRRSAIMAKVGGIVAIAVVALVIWFAYNSSKPKLLAKVGLTSKTVRITNGNDAAWHNATIILNDGFAGPLLILGGPWAPNVHTRAFAW
jgi:hypothetical protein